MDLRFSFLAARAVPSSTYFFMSPNALSKKLAAIFKRAGFLVDEQGKRSLSYVTGGSGGPDVWIISIMHPDDRWRIFGNVRISEGNYVEVSGKGNARLPYTEKERLAILEAVLEPFAR
jgi:hypothetical protein